MVPDNSSPRVACLHGCGMNLKTWKGLRLLLAWDFGFEAETSGFQVSGFQGSWGFPPKPPLEVRRTSADLMSSCAAGPFCKIGPRETFLWIWCIRRGRRGVSSPSESLASQVSYTCVAMLLPGGCVAEGHAHRKCDRGFCRARPGHQALISGSLPGLFRRFANMFS